MKKIVLFLIITALLLSFSVCFSISSAAETAKLTTDKDVYVVGEPIMVTASSDNASGKDWIGISPIGVNYAMRWDYLSDIGSGVQFDIRKCTQVVNNSSVSEYQRFPAGIYMISFMAEDDYFVGNKILARKTITILDEALPKSALKVEFTPTENTSIFPDGNLTVSLATEHNATHLYLWWADANGRKLSNQAFVTAEIPSYVNDEFIYSLSGDTVVPTEAKKLLVYTYSDIYGLSREGCTYILPNEIANNGGEPIPTPNIPETPSEENDNGITESTDVTSSFSDIGTETSEFNESGCKSSALASGAITVIAAAIFSSLAIIRKKEI